MRRDKPKHVCGRRTWREKMQQAREQNRYQNQFDVMVGVEDMIQRCLEVVDILSQQKYFAAEYMPGQVQ
jgi:hypothetical protein